MKGGGGHTSHAPTPNIHPQVVHSARTRRRAAGSDHAPTLGPARRRQRSSAAAAVPSSRSAVRNEFDDVASLDTWCDLYA